MDFLRQIVSGPKNRYKQKGFNLDLTYITPRIVAMAFPGSGIEKLYRNDVETIAKLLQQEHANKYITVNISGKTINQQIIKNVISYDWQDHKAPTFDTLFVICHKVALFLNKDPQNIAVFHCNHGKGRTGTIICCFFLFMEMFNNTKEVMDFYAKRRFEKQGYGVTQPCQIKYIQYFEEFLKKPNKYPQIINIKRIAYKGTFAFNQPYIKILDNSSGKTIYSTKDIESSLKLQKDHELVFRLRKQNFMVGDITILLKEQKVLGNGLIINYMFNTAFINFPTSQVGASTTHSILLNALSPLGKQKQANFGSDFQMLIQFRRHCLCSDQRNTKGCQLCGGILSEYDKKWQKIYDAYNSRKSYIKDKELICYGYSEIKHI